MKQKIEPSFPQSSLKFNFCLDGVFAFPEEWKTTDQANPGILGYVARTSSIEIGNGKVYARELTQKQKLQEQSKKKGGKKQSKEPVENAKSPQQIEKQEAQAKRLEEEWNKLSQQQKVFATNEDPFKSASLKFQEKQKQVQLKGKQYVVFQEHVLKDGGDWIYFYKLPLVNEEELGKLKKSKPKNLNLIDLNPVTMRAWMNLSELNENKKQINLRCQLEQVDKTEQTPSPNLQKTYIKINIKLENCFTPKADSYKVESVIKDPPQPEPVPEEIKCVQNMKQQFRIALQSIAMEYSTMFWKELNINQQQKQNQIFAANKKNDYTKRKQQFLYDFNVTGKYKILKERIKRTIVSLCEYKYKDKMAGQKSFTGISCSVKDQFYSEIYNFLVTSYSEIMDNLIKEKKQILGEVQVPNESTQKNMTKDILSEYKKESNSERLQRILAQYELINNFDYGEVLYLKSIEESPTDPELGFKYALYCIQKKLKTINEVLSYIQNYLQHNKADKDAQLTYILLMISSDSQQNLLKAWIILRSLICEDPENVKLLSFAHLLLNGLGDTECANKYLILAERAQLRKNQKLNQIGKHKQSPIASEIPSVSAVAAFSQALSDEQKSTFWMQILNCFIDSGLIWMSEKIKDKIQTQDNIEWKKIELKTLLFDKKYEECAEKALQLYTTTKEYLILQILLTALENGEDLEKVEKYLKISIKVCPVEKRSSILFKMGYLYLKMEKYGNSKACMIKYLDGNTNAGGLSWHYLGLAEYNCGNSGRATECLRHANLSDPYDSSVWGLLALCYADLNNFTMVNQCLNSYEKFSKEPSEKRLKEISSVLEKKEPDSFYDESVKKNLLLRLNK